LRCWPFQYCLLYSINNYRNICRLAPRRIWQAIFNKRPLGPKECKMKNVTYLGLCWGLTFSLVAVALGQQPATPGAPPAAKAPDNGQLYPADRQPGATGAQHDAIGQNGAQPRETTAPGSQPDQSKMPGGEQAGQAAMNGGQQRGVLGVFLVPSGGPGVAIRRITPGSAAEKAGLQSGDVVLRVNDKGAASPEAAAELIRQIPIGQAGTLTVWRDGDQHQMQFTMQAREIRRETPHEVGFRGEEGSSNGDLSSRTMRLEQQINSLTQELAALKRELAQLRSGAQPGGLGPDTTQSSTPGTAPSAAATAPGAAAPVGPPPGFGQPEEKPAKPAAEPAKSATPPAAAAPEKPAAPKTEEKPKTDSKGSSEDLFK
jgi:hypothetical protein